MHQSNPKAISNNKLIEALSLRVWWVWATLAVVVLVIQLLTINVLPHLQQDEAQITDYGRLALQPTSDWSVVWRVAEGKPLLLWSYLGPLIAEVGFQLFGQASVGPRIMALLGGILAGTMALGWLRARSVTVPVALSMSILLLLDPLFVLSQRMARVDSWVFAACLGCCWLLYSSKGAQAPWLIAFAGAAAGIAALIWPSAIFLYPLILLEFYNTLHLQGSIKAKIRELGKQASVFCCGWFLAVLLLLLPVWQSLALIFGDASSMVSHNLDTAKSLSDYALALFTPGHWAKLAKALIKTYTPLLPLLALLGFMVGKDWKLLLAAVTALLLIFISLVYEFRALYLLPYFIALASQFFARPLSGQRTVWGTRARRVAITLLLVWVTGISLGARTYFGLKYDDGRSLRKLHQVAANQIGPGEYNVFLGFTYELYYSARLLGWHVYTPYIKYEYQDGVNWVRQNGFEPADKFEELLRHMDYAVFAEDRLTPELQQSLNKAGLTYERAFAVSGELSSAVPPEEQNRLKAVLLWFLKGKDNYGPYRLYSRSALKETAAL